MDNAEGMTTPNNYFSQDNPRYIYSGAPLRNFSLKEIEDNNLEIVDDEPEVKYNAEVEDKLDRLESIINENQTSEAMIVEESARNERIEEEENEEDLANNNDSIDIGDNKEDIINSQPADAQIKPQNHKKEKVGFSRFPMSKIKNIMKLDDDIKLCQKNAYYVVCKMTELFLQELADNAHSVAKLNKRKTMNLEDIACAVKSSEKYSFIDVNTIFTVETIEDLRIKEEKFEKKIKQSEIKSEKKDKKDSKIEKVNKKNNIQANNMKIDKMFFTRQHEH